MLHHYLHFERDCVLSSKTRNKLFELLPEFLRLADFSVRSGVHSGLLIDMNKIMTQSFEMLVNRDKNLSKIQAQSATLRDSSKDLRKGAKNLKMAFLFRKYMTPIILCAIIAFFLLMYLFVF